MCPVGNRTFLSYPLEGKATGWKPVATSIQNCDSVTPEYLLFLQQIHLL